MTLAEFKEFIVVCQGLGITRVAWADKTVDFTARMEGPTVKPSEATKLTPDAFVGLPSDDEMLYASSPYPMTDDEMTSKPPTE